MKITKKIFCLCVIGFCYVPLMLLNFICYGINGVAAYFYNTHEELKAIMFM